MSANNGKQGKYCPFRIDHKCGDFCGLYCIGLKACVFHAINLNLSELKNTLDAGIQESENRESANIENSDEVNHLAEDDT